MRSATPAHPRSRGEHVGTNTNAFCHAGSSPLARGTRFHTHPGQDLVRLIPARAGNTRTTGRRASPVRLIPARAGNTPTAAPRPQKSPAHPRSRGEHNICAPTRNRVSGSSPLARETLRVLIPGFSSQRLISARAGNTILTARRPALRADHPRSRGEHPSRDI